uniref:NADH-ubiquinone oxidoreductase chain 4L n=1 Tax=Zaptyx daemonorum TaxID=1885783 RepID=A0A224AAJ8_9EUPU|nr:NADH dehydrogenase subunit 4L [Zaptyx daemonorum]BBA10673.1 NADH dehydrogenase subunit 4L [Zaptyx daemonorum]
MINLLNFSLLLLVILHLYLFFIKTHLLSSLLVLEAMVLMLLMITVSFSFCVLEGLSLYLFVLTLSVCEAAIGLTLLISIVKFNGSDHIKGNFLM